MCGECPPARFSHGRYVRTESNRPPKFVKNELNNRSQIIKAAAKASAPCFQPGSAGVLAGELTLSPLSEEGESARRCLAVHQIVTIAASAIAVTAMTKVS